ncbi:hypothetical protein LIP71_13345, partial [Mediterraneibacter faecis]|uniref:hypothetical protein n=1 Tax=Mediterraneibacter faecis TaxID=592978 RepID=UPI001D01CD06
LLFTPVSITSLIDTEDACFGLNASRPIAKGDLKWRDALLFTHRVNSNNRYGCLGHPKGLLMHNTIRYFSLLSFGSDVFFVILSVFFHYFIW